MFRAFKVEFVDVNRDGLEDVFIKYSEKPVTIHFNQSGQRLFPNAFSNIRKRGALRTYELESTKKEFIPAYRIIDSRI